MTDSTSPPVDGRVRHNEAANRFELDLDGQIAHADYRREGDALVFHHTYVPESKRGQGHAASVVRAGLEFARAQKLPVIPRCPYVARYIERHPEYAHLIAAHQGSGTA